MAGGSKRKRKAAEASAGRSSTDAKTSPAARKKTDGDSDFLLTLYNGVEKLIQSTEITSASILFLSNKAWALGGTPSEEEAALDKLPADQAYCFAIVLVTHVLYRLTAAVAEGTPDLKTIQVLAGWSRLLRTLADRLVPSCSKWDKATSGARHVLARVTATSAGASITALTSEPTDTLSLVAATVTLEETLLNCVTRPALYAQGHDFTTDACKEDMQQFPLTENSSKIADAAEKTNALVVETVKHSTTKEDKSSLFWTAFSKANAELDICEWTQIEWSCLKSLKIDDEVDDTPKKHGARRQPVDWSAAWEAFGKENKTSQTPLDCRLTARRWGAVMMDWFLLAGPRILSKAEPLLSANDESLDDLTDSNGWVIPGQVLSVVLVGRWARILAESSTRSGFRPPSVGGFDSYVKPLLPIGLRVKGKGAAKKASKPDTRDMTMVTVHSLLEIHAKCLKVTLDEGLPYCLWVTDIIRDLAASASVSGGLSGSESSECTERIQNAAAAYIPTIFDGTNHDWVLRFYGLSKLYQLLCSAREEAALPELFESSMVEAHGGLPTPSTLLSKPVAKKKKTDSPKNSCSYAGVYPKSESGKGVFEKIALHLRGYGTPTKSKQSRGSKSSGVVVSEFMINHWFALANDAMNISVPVPSMKRGKSRGGAGQRTGKKQRKEKEPPEFTLPASDSTNGKMETKSILSVARAKTTSKLLRLFDLFVAGKSCSVLRKLLPSMDEFMTYKGAAILLEFNMTAYRVLFASRSWAGSKLSEVASAVGTDGSGILSGTRIVPEHESELWSNLVSANATLGSGRQDNLSFESKNENILGEQRLNLYKIVASTSATTSGQDVWPLWIPTPMRVFVSCNLCAEKMISDQVDFRADHFILNGFLDGLRAIFTNPAGLFRKDSRSPRPCVEEEVLLSLFDARVIIGTCARLPDADQVAFLDRFLDVVTQKLEDCVNGGMDLLAKEETATFLARVVTTATHVATLVGCSSEYRQYIQRLLCDSFSRRLCAWASTDKHVAHISFMGISSTWESTDLPDGVRAKESLPGSLFTKLQHVIVTAFSLGFSSTSSDHGHLLYAAWNAHGKAALWNPAKDTLSISGVSLEDAPSAILKIRNDLCLVHRRIRSDQGIMAKSHISKSLDRTLSAGSPRTIVDNLKTLVEKGSEHIHSILDAAAKTEGHLLSTSTCGLLESLCVCVSFGISLLTVTDSSFFSELMSRPQLSRPRGYSTDSEHVDSDGDSTCSKDARVNASERLAEVCRAFGAVPAHPDWLDTSCTLRYGVTRAEVRGLATTALRAFTRLVKTGLEERSQNIQYVIGAAGVDHSSSRLFLESTSLLNTLSGSSESARSETALKAISSLCGVEETTSKYLVGGLGMGLKTSTADFWCTNASQQIVGEMHSLVQSQLILPSEIGTSELRATGDWEIALAASLLSGVFDVDSSTDLRIVSSSRWASLAESALEWMVPSCALLHFSLQTSGKNHPLKSLNCSVEEFTANGEIFVDPTNPTTRLSGSQHDSVLETLGIVCCPVTSKEKATHAIASHLIGSGFEYRYLMHVGKVVLAVQVLTELLSRPAGSLGDNASLLSSLVSSIIENMKNGDGLRCDWPLTRLIAASAHGTMIDINSLALGKLNLIDRIPSEMNAWCKTILLPNIAVELFISNSVAMLCGLLFRSDLLSLCTMQFVTAVLASLSSLERGVNIDQKLNRLIANSVIGNPGDLFNNLSKYDRHARERIALDLSNLCAAPFLADVEGDLNTYASTLCDTLHTIVRENTKGKLSPGVLHLLLLCGTYTGRLGEIGESLLKTELQGIENYNTAGFSRFVSSLAACLSKKASETFITFAEVDEREKQLCSFVVKEGFQEQHWYNCRTCELTGEKGCCSICARVCHDGHDVVYARFSSFFCDCGAESAKSKEESMPYNCRCLSPSEGDALVLPEGKPLSLPNISEPSMCARIATSFFRDKSQNALRRVKSAVGRNNWVPKLSEAVGKAVEKWKQAVQHSSEPTGPVSFFTDGQPAPSQICLKLDDYTPLHSSKSGVFDTSTLSEEPQRHRCIITADSCGRLVVCEGPRLRFLAVSTMIDASFANDKLDFERSEIPFIGSVVHDVKEAIGMRLSVQNEHHLLVWSSRSVSVFILNPFWSGVIKRIQLPLEGISISSKITRCEWLPGTEGYVLVGFGEEIRLWKVSTEASPVVARVSVTEGMIDDQIKDFVVVAKLKGYTVVGWKLFILLARGGLIDKYIPRDELYSEGVVEYFIDKDNTNLLCNVFDDDAGGRLDYLDDACLLICQTTKSGVNGLLLENGELKHRQVLLNPEPLSMGESADSPVEFLGPYTHWHSIGQLSGDNDCSRLRLCCAARVKGSTDSVFLHLIIGESVLLKVSKPFIGSVEGSTLSSVPFTEDDHMPFDLTVSKHIVERFVVTHLTSNGCLTSYIETLPHRAGSTGKRGKCPVDAFEKLQKISRPGSLNFHVDGMSDDIGGRVMRDNDEFLVCPEGFTMNISLNPLDTSVEHAYLIAGVQIQVGRTSIVRIPTSIFVEGRKISMKKGTSEWYAGVLTAEEVARVARKGFVTIKVESGHIAGNTPVIDSVEVYGIPRSTACHWVNSLPSGSERTLNRRELQQMERLLLSIESLRSIKSIGNDKGTGAFDFELLKTVVYETALGCSRELNDCVVGLVETFEGELNENSQSLLDSIRVKACSDFVKRNDWQHSGLHRGEHFISQLEDCLRLSCDIAKNRPSGYLKAMDTDGGSPGSIALPASKLLENDHLRHLATDDAVTQLTELCLIEMAIAGGSAMQSVKLDHFAALQRLLQSQTGRILNATCRSVHQFCNRFRSQKLLGDEPDPFAAQTMAAFYGCDSCSLFPIKGTRYTLAKDHHSFDLCEECYGKASKFASSNKSRKGKDVVVDGKTVGDEAAKLSCNEVRSMKAVLNQVSVTGDEGAEVVQRQQVYEEFLGNLFVSLMGLFPDEIESKGYVETDFVQLATDLVNLSEEGCRTERKKRLAKKIVESLSSFVSSYHGGVRQRQSVLACVNSLSQLIVADRDARIYFSSTQASSLESSTVKKGGTDLQCDIHHCPLELRRLKGDVGKKFITCKSDRCGSFAWVKEKPEDAAAHLENIFDNEAARSIWALLAADLGEFCLLESLSELVEDTTGDEDCSPQDNNQFYPYTFEQATNDFANGVISGSIKSRKTSLSHFLQRLQTLPRKGENDTSPQLLIDVCMELLSLSAPAKEKRAPLWHSLLCRMISTEQVLSRKNLAKSTLFRLCGADHDVYHSVRDHFAMSFQLRELTEHSHSLITQALVVKEKAHVCGKNWRVAVDYAPSKINGFDLVGTQDLIPEGALSVVDSQAIRSALDEVLSIAKRRSRNWQAFSVISKEKLKQEHLTIGPLSIILSLALTLEGDAQLKAMKLCELASPLHDSQKSNRRQGNEEFCSRLPLGSLSPSDAVLAFATHFVLKGRSTELRRISCTIAVQMIRHAGRSVVQDVFPKLMTILEVGAGEQGKDALELAALLTSIAHYLGDDPKLGSYAKSVEGFWLQQMCTLRQHRANEELLTCESRYNLAQKRRFDIGFCSHCSKPHSTGSIANKRTETSERQSRTSAGGRGAQSSSRRSGRHGNQNQGDTGKSDWIDGQISPFSRSRVHSLREGHVSDEFSSYIELKNRMIVSEIHLEAHDPRGRFVKTINVYWAPRPVSETRELLSDTFQTEWEKFGTMQLSRGSSRGSITASKPVIAASLKIEYSDFYERPGDSRQPDNGFVIHCPRCSRIVQNAHGVCGNCGEVAFQCRKCRHINYDRLDAFLCVECGYCASGTFSYEIVAATATNAVAITNDKEYQKARNMLAVCTRIREDIRSMLKERHSLLTKSSKRSEKESYWGSDDLRRVYAGQIPSIPWQKNDHPHFSLQTLGKQGSVVRTVARPENLDMAGRGSTDRNCTFNALSRSASSSGGEGRHSSDDIVVQQIRAEIDEDESEILGLLEGSGRAGALDSSDPISRLLARVRSRHEQSENDRHEEGGAAAAPVPISNKTKSITTKECLELCEHLHMLMREAEREAFELQRRIQAWERLNRDDLAGIESTEQPKGYVPCRCSNCSSAVASCLLSLWQRLFQANPKEVIPSEEIVETLLQNEASLTSSSHRALQDCKRLAVESIATQSSSGAQLVLDGLRKRFGVGQDVYAAELLGRVLESLVESPLRSEFIKLAEEQLERQQHSIVSRLH